jgi:hypothetical protein
MVLFNMDNGRKTKGFDPQFYIKFLDYLNALLIDTID